MELPHFAMTNKLLDRPRATVRIVTGTNGLIGKTRAGRVGVITKRYEGRSLREGEIWLVDIVREYPGYFIMLPTERIKHGPQA
jgi:hypothetical protein